MSISHPKSFYTGFTEHRDQRLSKHNQKKCDYTSKQKPWKIITSIVLTDQEKALDFERYLKTSSGKALAQKRLLLW